MPTLTYRHKALLNLGFHIGAISIIFCLTACNPKKNYTDHLQYQTQYKFIDRGYYQLTGVIITKAQFGLFEKFFTDGPFAEIAPYDLGVAVGHARHPEVIAKLKAYPVGRFLYRSGESLTPNKRDSENPEEEFGELNTQQNPLTPTELSIVRGIRNNHIIAFDSQIERQLSKLKVGDTVFLEGYLVDIVLPNGTVIPTSLSRDDTGPGACEIFVVKKIDLLR